MRKRLTERGKEFTFCQQQDVVKEVVGLWGGLQQGDHGGVVESVRLIPQELDDGIGGAAVQTCADFIHEEDCLGANHHFTCEQQHGLSSSTACMGQDLCRM